MTNREKINQMSNEELAILLGKQNSVYCGDCVAFGYDMLCCDLKECKKVIEKWLESEVKE